MQTSNPALNEKVFNREIAAQRQSGYAQIGSGSTLPGVSSAIIDDDVMRVSGVASATAWLAVVLVAAAYFGWHSVAITTARNIAGETVVANVHIPGWIWPAWIAGFVLAIVTILKPSIAKYTATLYSVAQGLFLGAISKIFDVQYNGIVLQAVLLTGAVFLIMWALFVTGTIKVTNKLRTGVMVATGAVLAVYVFSWIMSFFGGHMPMIYNSGAVGIGFSLLVVGIAAFNLLLDFDFVERAVQARAPRNMEWFAAFGLMVTLIWLYLELLRLLAKLRD